MQILFLISGKFSVHRGWTPRRWWREEARRRRFAAALLLQMLQGFTVSASLLQTQSLFSTSKGFSYMRIPSLLCTYSWWVLASREQIMVSTRVHCSGSDGKVGPSPRAFHIVVSIDCPIFVFGGRSSGRLGDFWVLDTDIWKWSELTSFGDLPSPRDFAATVAIGNQKIVMYGGWDGKKWLFDVYLLDTSNLLPVTPPSVNEGMLQRQ